MSAEFQLISTSSFLWIALEWNSPKSEYRSQFTGNLFLAILSKLGTIWRAITMACDHGMRPFIYVIYFRRDVFPEFLLEYFDTYLLIIRRCDTVNNEAEVLPDTCSRLFCNALLFSKYPNRWHNIPLRDVQYVGEPKYKGRIKIYSSTTRCYLLSSRSDNEFCKQIWTKRKHGLLLYWIFVVYYALFGRKGQLDNNL